MANDQEEKVWEKAAAYLIAMETCSRDCTEEIFNKEVDKWKDINEDAIRAVLKFMAGKGGRAARHLLGELGGERSWSKETEKLQLKDLHLRGGGGSDNQVAKLLKCFHKSKKRVWNVKECAAILKCIPEPIRDERVKAYFTTEKIPKFKQALIVGEENCKEDKRLYIGDGYHRAVIMWNAGISETDCYVGRLKS